MEMLSEDEPASPGVVQLFTDKQSSSGPAPYLPFKDAKMRQLFKDGGHNSITAVIFTISPWKVDIESSIATMKFA